ncbi:MAG: PIN domain-containing protein [Phycisphaerales bacterium]|nr:PIN domain-containing protein [Phycisphaerales bacterium]
MIIPDVNLFLYTYNLASPFHAEAKRWCERVMSGPEPLALIPAVIFGFVRIATHPKVFTSPFSVREAQEHVSSWLALPHVQVVDLLREDVEVALDLLRIAGTAGNLTTDAQIAAVAIRLDATVHTADLDFARFRGVKLFNPIFK